MPASTDPIVEEQTDQCPGGKVQRRSGRKPAHGSEHYGRVEIARDGFGELERGEIEDHRQQGAEKPEVVDRLVNGPSTQEFLGADDTPDNA